MDSRTGRILVIVVASLAGIASFAVTRLSAGGQSGQSANPEAMLAQSSGKVGAMEAQFNTKAGELANAMSDAQLALGKLLEDPSSSGDAVLAQAEKVSEAHTALFRLAAQYAIDLRSQLPNDQCRRVMQYCGGIVCGSGTAGGGPRYQGGRGGMGMGMRRGRGNGFGGRGMGPGGGMRARRGRGFACQLAMTDRQIAAIDAKDPTYPSERDVLQQQLIDARCSLGALLQDTASSDAAIETAVDTVVGLHHQLDSRVAKHVAIMRDELTVAQQKQLMGLCAGRGCRNAVSR